MPDGPPARDGRPLPRPRPRRHDPPLGRDGAAPLRDGDLARACVDLVREQGGALTIRDPRRARADRPRSARDRLPRPRRAHDAPIVGRRHAPRRRPACARRERWPARRPRAMLAAMDLAQSIRTPAFARDLTQDGFAHEILARRATAPSSSRPCSRASPEHDAPRRARRRRPGLLGDLQQRRVLRTRRARHRHPPQQRDGRGRPQPARIRHVPRRRRMPSMKAPRRCCGPTVSSRPRSLGRSNRIRSRCCARSSHGHEQLPLPRPSMPRRNREGDTVYVDQASTPPAPKSIRPGHARELVEFASATCSSAACRRRVDAPHRRARGRGRSAPRRRGRERLNPTQPPRPRFPGRLRDV